MWAADCCRCWWKAARACDVCARHPEHLASRVPVGVEVLPGDVLDAATLSRAMQGVHSAYYMVHSMGTAGDFEEKDRIAADNFAAAARAAGVQRIISRRSRGGRSGLSAHLRSRHEVGDRLRAHGVPVIELRASIIIGSDSLSFEMIRALVERLPVMVTPRWVQVKVQPIAIGDVLDYLCAALTVENGNRSLTIEIGGPESILLWRAHPRIRTAAWAAAQDDPRTVADTTSLQSLAWLGHPALCPGRAQVDR